MNTKSIDPENTKYNEIKDMMKDNPDKAQEIMFDLAEKYNDTQLAQLWEIKQYKVGELRRNLGIIKDSGGNIRSVEEVDLDEEENTQKTQQTKQKLEPTSDRSSLHLNNIDKDELLTLVAMLDQSDVTFDVQVKMSEQKRRKEIV